MLDKWFELPDGLEIGWYQGVGGCLGVGRTVEPLGNMWDSVEGLGEVGWGYCYNCQGLHEEDGLRLWAARQAEQEEVEVLWVWVL